MSEAPELATPTLGTAAAEVEQAFLVTGQQLENAIAILDRLRKRFAEYTAELTGAALGNTSDELGNATQQIAGLTDVRNADAGTLDSLRELIIRRKLGPGHQLRQDHLATLLGDFEPRQMTQCSGGALDRLFNSVRVADR